MQFCENLYWSTYCIVAIIMSPWHIIGFCYVLFHFYINEWMNQSIYYRIKWRRWHHFDMLTHLGWLLNAALQCARILRSWNCQIDAYMDDKIYFTGFFTYEQPKSQPSWLADTGDHAGMCTTEAATAMMNWNCWWFRFWCNPDQNSTDMADQ